MHLGIKDHKDIIFEWISYNQFNNIEKISNDNSSTIYSAIWKNGPLYYNNEYKYTRKLNKKVVLRCILNSQNNADEFLIEV